jgi:hypothetical protein
MRSSERRRQVLVLAVLALGALPAELTAAEPQGDGTKTQETGKDGGKKNGTVLTFYGLRKLEEDPQVPDEEKLKEWHAFIERATEQIQYARKAVDRWKNAARVRLVEAAKSSDRDASLDAKEKIKRWDEVQRLYPNDPESRAAQKRIAYWTQEQTKKLVEAAENVERSRRPKVERIQAWLEVLAWVTKGSEAKAANKRVDSLQEQLFSEARSVDAIARVDDKTKLAAWKDVLAGRPTNAQEKQAQQRVAELQASLPPEQPKDKASAPNDGGAHATDAHAKGDAQVKTDGR